MAIAILRKRTEPRRRGTGLKPWAGLWVLGSLFTVAGCGSSGPPRHEVVGTVLVDGQPAERVVVQFDNQDSSTTGDDRYPIGITDSAGRFRIGDKSVHAGAAAGTYRVLFSWLSSPDLDAVDRFGGVYADATRSETPTVTVPAQGDLVFELKMPSRK